MKKIALYSLILTTIITCIIFFLPRVLRQPKIQVGIIAWLGSGAVVGSSEINAAELFLEEHPESKIEIVPVDDKWDPEVTTAITKQSIENGVQFFISSHPSKCAVAIEDCFDSPGAMVVVAAATSPALTDKDDYIFRIIADAECEQEAIAGYIQQLEGSRILVIQDEGNLPYTDPAFYFFSETLKVGEKWEITHCKMKITDFTADTYKDFMSPEYDVLYILAGSYQTSIGNIAQLFHHLHPEKPIILTPWARSPSILEIAGPAISQMVLPSQYPSRRENPVIDIYFNRFKERFGYEPHSMTIGIWQAMELFHNAFSAGCKTPEEVKNYFLTNPVHQTTLGTVTFNEYGDVNQEYYFIKDMVRELK